MISDKYKAILNKGSLTQENSVKIMKLSGSNYEIGFQHGFFLSEQFNLFDLLNNGKS